MIHLIQTDYNQHTHTQKYKKNVPEIKRIKILVKFGLYYNHFTSSDRQTKKERERKSRKNVRTCFYARSARTIISGRDKQQARQEKDKRKTAI